MNWDPDLSRLDDVNGKEIILELHNNITMNWDPDPSSLDDVTGKEIILELHNSYYNELRSWS